MIELDHFDLNASIKLKDEEGNLQLFKDKEALKSYFLNDVNQNTVFFHSLEEKIEYLLNEDYYEKEIIDQYSFDFIKKLFKLAYSKKFRFKSFVGAYKYYQSYTLKTFDGKRFLERYEDRVCMNALYLACGDEKLAVSIVEEIISNRYQPATPTFLNAGKKSRGEMISCFLLNMFDSMNSISRSINAALQLSKRGGGVAFALTNIRETGAPIKKVKGQSSGIIPIMKLFEDSFSYANQLGARSGAGAVYLNAHHPEIMEFLDTKRENADEKVRIKTLSLGVVIPDITFELAKKNEDMYLFSPYDIQRVYGVPMTDISITEKYYEMVDNPEITKRKISARVFFQTIAELQFESGYPYIMFEDTVNYANPIDGRVIMSNLCQTGDVRINTDKGYKRLDELYATQEDFNVVVDTRARDMDIKKRGTSIESSTRMFLTAKDSEVYCVETNEGFRIRGTLWHKMYVKRDGEVIKIPLSEVTIGDKLLVQSGNGSHGTINEPELAYIAGVVAADGSLSERSENHSSLNLGLYGSKREFADEIEKKAEILIARKYDGGGSGIRAPKFKSCDDELSRLYSAPLAHILNKEGIFSYNKSDVPEFVFSGDKETRIAYLNGLFQIDGTVWKLSNKNLWGFSITSINKKSLQDIQMLLLDFGIYSRVGSLNTETEERMIKKSDGTVVKCQAKPAWRLTVGDRESRNNLNNIINWKKEHRDVINEVNESHTHTSPRHDYCATVKCIEFDGIEDVYDVTVENGHSVVFNGIATGQCSEILQTSEESEYNEDLSYSKVGKDISCNLGSMNVALAMESPNFGKTVDAAIRSLTAVSELSNISSVPSIEKGNNDTHAIGLGQMNLHGFFAKEHMYYGSEESIDFTDMYFYTVAYHAYKASCAIAKERKQWFKGFEKSQYANGEYFKKYTDEVNEPKTKKVKKIFEKYGVEIPTQEDWIKLTKDIKKYGLYNAYLQAVPPTGSISYINNATASIHPIVDKVEVRKEGKLGRVYYPAPHLSTETLPYFETAYDIGYEKIIDVYAAATKHIDQGLSLTLFFKDTATTRDINKAQIYAWKKGIKTLYYIRVKQEALDGVDAEIEECESCKL